MVVISIPEIFYLVFLLPLTLLLSPFFTDGSSKNIVGRDMQRLMDENTLPYKTL